MLSSTTVFNCDNAKMFPEHQQHITMIYPITGIHFKYFKIYKKACDFKLQYFTIFS